MTQLTQMETLVPGLYATVPAPLPFGRSLEIRAFLLQREHGNVLVYGVPHLEREIAQIVDLGGVARQYVGHGHEAGFTSDAVPAPRFVHEADRAALGDLAVRVTFSRRHHLDDDLEVIPIPGHTPGSTAYLWDTGDHRILFTADTVLLGADGEWDGGVLDSSDRPAYLDSLRLIRELDFDVLVPWVATAGQPYVATTDRADARRRIDALRGRVEGMSQKQTPDRQRP